MAVTPLPSVDLEMADAASETHGLTSPPKYNGSFLEDPVEGKINFPNNQLTSLEKVNLESTINNSESAQMARRSTRNANRPKPVVASPTRPAKRKIVIKTSVAKKPKWTAEKLLTDEKSPLASADLRTILCQPAAWDILTPVERAEIITLFPDGTRILDEGTEDARPDFNALLNDNNFRHDCATYTDNIAQGKHDPEWLEQAWAARERRRAGDFNRYLAQKFEEDWSYELPKGFRLDRNGDVPLAEDIVDGQDGARRGKKTGSPLRKPTLPETSPVPHSAPPSDPGKEEVAPKEPNNEVKDGPGEAHTKVDSHAGEIAEASGAPSAVYMDSIDENDVANEPRVALGSPIPDDNNGGSRAR